jgi:hypothetical protein
MRNVDQRFVQAAQGARQVIQVGAQGCLWHGRSSDAAPVKGAPHAL